MVINVDNTKAQMRKGILEYCILSILSREDSYAPKIIAELPEVMEQYGITSLNDIIGGAH